MTATERAGEILARLEATPFVGRLDAAMKASPEPGAAVDTRA